MKFTEFPLNPKLLQVIQNAGFESPTPVQEKAIPAVLEGKDVLACAQTGTGKTLAYLAPALHLMFENKNMKVVVLVPTRELGQQVYEVAKGFTAALSLPPAALLIGGLPMFKQTRSLRAGARLLIATPGRLIDHITNKALNLSEVKMMVLDEADRMIDIGFAPQLHEILKSMPQQKQTLMFTATLAGQVGVIAQNYMNKPEKIILGHTMKATTTVVQKSIEVQQRDKNAKLLEVLTERKDSALVFVKTQVRTEVVADHLESYGFKVGVIHGGRSQSQRTRTLDSFRAGRVQVLVATDVAARGLDIDHIGFVVNYDLPQMAEDYIHRVGRTGRAGRSGEALSFISKEEFGIWRTIQRMSGNEVPKSPFGERRGGAPRSGGRGGFGGRDRDRRSSGFGEQRRSGRPAYRTADRSFEGREQRPERPEARSAEGFKRAPFRRRDEEGFAASSGEGRQSESRPFRRGERNADERKSPSSRSFAPRSPEFRTKDKFAPRKERDFARKTDRPSGGKSKFRSRDQAPSAY